MARVVTFQSTRPRGARRGYRKRAGGAVQVSIHAPARGATGIAIPKLIPVTSFNPRARAGRDGNSLWISSLTVAMFQSTRPRGARRRWRRSSRGLTPVSIHAPARGATCTRGLGPHTRAGFNPRARAGRDDLASFLIAVADASFNPRARAGRDPTREADAQGHPDVSIHAPARGATPSRGGFPRSSRCFNPRARAGRDTFPWIPTCRSTSFNPRARAGRDSCWTPRPRG